MRYYPNHLGRTVGRCGYLAQATTRPSESHSVIHLSHARCKSYSCPECRRKNLKQLRGRVYQATASGTWRFLTLTIPVGRLPSQERYLALAKVWRLFAMRLRQRFPALKYIKVLDTGSGGNCHYHVLCDTWIDRAWLLDTWVACGGGYIVDIRLIPSQSAAAYICKYITSLKEIRKNVEQAIYESACRRFSTSQHTMPEYDRHYAQLLCRSYSIDTLLDFLITNLWHNTSHPVMIPIASCYSPP